MEALDRNAYLDRPVGEVVAENYGRAAVFTRLGIDFCCGGRRTVAEAGATAGVSESEIVDALSRASLDAMHDRDADPRSWSVGRLTRHIETTHHAYVRETLPVLEKWLEKLVRVHGPAHPELLEVRAMVAQLGTELEEHMTEEELRLFPILKKLESTESGPPTADLLSGEILGELEDDHERAGDLMRRIRSTTDDFQPPRDACSTYSATFALLKEFETDLHRHVHLENNILFPRVQDRGGRE